MKKLFLLLTAGLLTYSMSASEHKNSSFNAAASIANVARGYGNSFIFMEAGIEFSVFPDGQFDFFIPNHGPNVNVGLDTPIFSFSFNSGYNYNPFVQYDSFGAIIQIENTPVFYDYFGRVNQIGNIFINYNNFGRVNRIGGLNIFYRNNVFWRYDGFINQFNNTYVYRPWHRFYALPPTNLCVVNTWAYRQFYTPIRHVWYRPYVNNARYVNINARRNYNRTVINNTINRRYLQTPRTRADRQIRNRVTRRNAEIYRTRSRNITTPSVARQNTRRNTLANRTESRRSNSSEIHTRKSNSRFAINSEGITQSKRVSRSHRSPKVEHHSKSRSLKSNKPTSINKGTSRMERSTASHRIVNRDNRQQQKRLSQRSKPSKVNRSGISTTRRSNQNKTSLSSRSRRSSR